MNAAKACTRRIALRHQRAHKRMTFNQWVTQPLSDAARRRIDRVLTDSRLNAVTWILALSCTVVIHGIAGTFALLAPFAPSKPIHSNVPLQRRSIRVALHSPENYNDTAPAVAVTKPAQAITSERTDATPSRQRVRSSVKPPRRTRNATAAPPPVVGISFALTTHSGSGSSFATGNTLLGSTAARAVAPKVATDAVSNDGNAASISRILAAGGGKKLIKPSRLSEPDPPYPAIYRAQALEADVTVLIRIDDRGYVRTAKLVAAAAYPLFNEVALAHARAARFSPATVDGQPIAYTLSFTYRFRLND